VDDMKKAEITFNIYWKFGCCLTFKDGKLNIWIKWLRKKNEDLRIEVKVLPTAKIGQPLLIGQKYI